MLDNNLIVMDDIVGPLNNNNLVILEAIALNDAIVANNDFEALNISVDDDDEDDINIDD